MGAVGLQQRHSAVASQILVERLESLLSVVSVPLGVWVERCAHNVGSTDFISSTGKVLIDRRLDESRDAGGACLGVFSPNNARWAVLVVGDDVVPHESSCFAYAQPCGHLEQG